MSEPLYVWAEQGGLQLVLTEGEHHSLWVSIIGTDSSSGEPEQRAAVRIANFRVERIAEYAADIHKRWVQECNALLAKLPKGDDDE